MAQWSHFQIRAKSIDFFPINKNSTTHSYTGTRTRFETEVKCNSEIAYSLRFVVIWLGMKRNVFAHLSFLIISSQFNCKYTRFFVFVAHILPLIFSFLVCFHARTVEPFWSWNKFCRPIDTREVAKELKLWVCLHFIKFEQICFRLYRVSQKTITLAMRWKAQLLPLFAPNFQRTVWNIKYLFMQEIPGIKSVKEISCISLSM